ncbi:MAG: substrate-binding domain-containing protein [Lachnospiraceae bacterium]|nr:substrate-binding domain-containing protein [Lachnospiraceae bacterium]
MLKLSRIYVVAAMVALMLAGCGQKDNVSANAPVMEKKQLLVNGADYLSVEGIELQEETTIAMVATNGENRFFDTIEKGALQAVADLNTALGYTGKNKIKLSYAAPKGEDVIEQINIIDQFLDKAPDALCVAFTDAKACKTQMDMAKNNGIKTIGFDTSDDEKMTEILVATNNQKAAEEAAKKMFEAIDYKGKIAIVVHNSLTQTAQVRKQAIIDQMTQNYNDKDIQFVEIIYAAQEERTGTEILTKLMEKHDDLAGVICTDLLTTEMVIDYVKTLEEQTFQVVGFDTSEKIVSEVGNILVGTMAQDPYHMGYATVVAAARSISGMGNVANIYTEHIWIDGENVDTAQVQSVLNY